MRMTKKHSKFDKYIFCPITIYLFDKISERYILLCVFAFVRLRGKVGTLKKPACGFFHLGRKYSVNTVFGV